MRHFWIGFWAIVSVVLLSLAFCSARAAVDAAATPHPIVTAIPCEPLGPLMDRLAMSGVPVGLEGEGVQSLIAVAWAVTGGGPAPRAARAVIVLYGNMAGFYPVTADGLVCASLLVSSPVFERIMAAARGEPL